MVRVMMASRTRGCWPSSTARRRAGVARRSIVLRQHPRGDRRGAADGDRRDEALLRPLMTAEPAAGRRRPTVRGWCTSRSGWPPAPDPTRRTPQWPSQSAPRSNAPRTGWGLNRRMDFTIPDELTALRKSYGDVPRPRGAARRGVGARGVRGARPDRARLKEADLRCAPLRRGGLLRVLPARGGRRLGGVDARHHPARRGRRPQRAAARAADARRAQPVRSDADAAAPARAPVGDVPRPARTRGEVDLLRAHRARGGQRRPGDPHPRPARRRRVGHRRDEALHHQRGPRPTSRSCSR